jgi:TrmH family RNA methyltransferase
MFKYIKSRENKKIKYVQSLKRKKTRMEESSYIIEGKKVVFEAKKFGADIKSVFVSESFSNRNPDLEKLESEIYVVSDELFDKISDTVNSQGIIAVLGIKFLDIEMIDGGRFIFVDEIQDPGNLGGIIRGIDAFSFDGLILGPNSVDVLNEKCVRSSMGSIFRIKIFKIDEKSEISKLKEKGIKIISSNLKKDSKKPQELDLKEKFAIIIGNEGNGVSKEAESYADECSFIPMSGNAESLNANVAAHIFMYESERQRNYENLHL